MMGTIQLGYINTGLQCSKFHKDTSLAIQQAIYIYRSQIQPVYISIGFQDHSLTVISTELLYKLTLFKYLMWQVNVNWRHYNSYVVIYSLRQSYNVFTAKLKFNVCIYKIREKLSYLHTCLLRNLSISHDLI